MISNVFDRKCWLRLLYDRKIITVHADEDFCFDPDYQIEPDAINFRLHPVLTKIRVNKRNKIDLLSHQAEFKKKYTTVEIPWDGLELAPGSLYLGKTLEVVSINSTKYMGLIFNRPIISKLGINIHFSQNKLPPGVYWAFPLQIFNASPVPIKIYPFMFICQMILIEYNDESHRLYTGKNVFSAQINSWSKGIDNEEEKKILDTCDKYKAWLEKKNNPKDLGKEELLSEHINEMNKRNESERKRKFNINLKILTDIPKRIIAPLAALIVVIFEGPFDQIKIVQELRKPLTFYIFIFLLAFVFVKPFMKFIAKIYVDYRK